MSEFEPVHVTWKNGATYICRSAEQLASFLEDGWTIDKPKPARKRATKAVKTEKE